MIRKECYRRTPTRDHALFVRQHYVDAKLTREEIATLAGASDVYHDWQRRVSPDNGRTWSEPERILEPLPGIPLVQNRPEGGVVVYPQTVAVDTPHGRVYRFFMQRLFPGRPPFGSGRGGPHVDHVFVSEDDGPPIMLRYEDGPECDWDLPFVNPEYARTNQAYFGVNAAMDQDGTVFFPVSAPGWRDGSLQNGMCLFRREPSSGRWLASNVVFIPPEQSARGLLEPGVARLNNGTILVICRGSNTEMTAGRKWFAVSTDNGRTLSTIGELRYQDGTRFYSPSSMHRLVRNSRNGALYWVANIVPDAPRGNRPRYPLVIARIDEDRPAVIRSSLETVDTRGEGDPETVQFSNFGVLEDRETGRFEIFMNRLGEVPGRPWHGDAYRYVFEP